MNISYGRDVYRPNPTSYLLAKAVSIEVTMGLPSRRLLDLGTGCGVVARSAASVRRPGLDIVASDISSDACDLALSISKMEGLKIDVRQGDWFQPLEPGEKFDVICCHPPAVPYGIDGDWGLPVAIRVATEAGIDGTRCALHVASEARAHLAENGKLLFGLPHWCNTAKIMSFLSKQFSQVRILDQGVAPFFPLLDGNPDDACIRNLDALAKSGEVEIIERDGLVYSPISIIEAV